ncbi:hypothetical protein [Blastopirellula retiformator]|uniref:GAF domain-containing protein n=1 Tax=Blastopirellula retiformator TaxID=2527970 RepID=A0A5C5VPT7_9BACT|nr:hypothetical protein [Blastopirellula retiformator]TWT39632.1 hypothetical protein Enr8_13320 [Blastopirellula retiformator]
MAKARKSRIPTPKTSWQRIIERHFVYDVIIAWFALFAGAATAMRSFAVGKWPDFIAGCLYVIGALGIVVLACLKFRAQWKKQEDEDSIHDLEACLYVLHHQLMQAVPREARQDTRIRLTIHVPDFENSKLVQALDYVGGDPDEPTSRRKFNIKAGIIGRAITKDRCITAKRENNDAALFFKDLTEVWGFTKAEAKRLDPLTRSWVAIPIGSPIQGVLYADSTCVDFFDDESVLQLFPAVAVAISRYIEVRY